MTYLDDLRQKLAYLEQSDVLAGHAAEVRKEIAELEAAETLAEPDEAKPKKSAATAATTKEP